MSHPNHYVILADDDKDDIDLMQEAFRRKKIEEKLLTVRNGEELLRYLHTVSDGDKWPRLILLDLNMPVKNGRETLREIKEHYSLKKIPVVIYSTSSEDAEIKECYELGANSYVVKPVGFDKLLTTIDAIHAYWCKAATVVF